MDMKFAKVTDYLDLLDVDTTTISELIRDIDRDIWVIKERSLISSQSFKSIQEQIMIQLLYFMVMWLNKLPANQGMSKKYWPWEIITWPM